MPLLAAASKVVMWLAVWFTPTAGRRAKSTGRRNTSITEEFGDGNGRLEQEDQRRT
jgi:hypothetical protein